MRHVIATFVGLGMLLGGGAMACDHWNPPPQTDVPDDNFIDSNGDGIDGMRCGPIFVSPEGNDRNVGTIDRPMRSINAAIMAASQMTPKRDVYVSSETTYYETLWLLPGVNIYAGYNHNTGWSRSSKKAILRGGNVGAWAWPQVTPLPGQIVHSLEIYAEPNSLPGGHSVGLVINGEGFVQFQNTVIRGGNAGTGLSGAAGTAGQHGRRGEDGRDGHPDKAIIGGYAMGGSGFHNGGQGGRGQYGESNGTNGFPGKGPAGGAAGSGGRSGDPGGDGTNGSPGGHGERGAHGAGAARWYASGADGSPGTGGSGGGGGGGGGGQHCFFCLDGTGNSGGGGGGGGYNGTGGKGGGYGGSSIAVLARGSGGYVFTENTSLYAGKGGYGGRGGPGGAGGTGGPGGVGGSVATNEVGRGGNGGAGGNGGTGGSGGGGAGGSSIVVMREGGLVSSQRNNWYPDAAGLGGFAPAGGKSGVAGLSTKYYEVQALDPKIHLGTNFQPLATHARGSVSEGATSVVMEPVLAHPSRPAFWTLQILTPPSFGTATAGGQNLTYQPAPGFSGWDTFSYRLITGGQNITGWAVVYVSPPQSNTADALRALRIAGGLKSQTPADAALDTTGDGYITLRDALEIVRGL